MTKEVKLMSNIIIVGAGGHAKVIADIIIKSGNVLLGFLDDNKIGENIIGFPVLGIVDDIKKYSGETEFIIGIGNNYKRKEIAEKYNVNWHTAIHPSTEIGTDVTIEKGTVVMANVVINTSTRIGKHCVINTGSIVEHDNIIEDYVHISPNATLCGTVKIGARTHIGAGAIIRNNIEIGSDIIIGVGSVATKNLLDSGTYIGVPAKKVG